MTLQVYYDTYLRTVTPAFHWALHFKLHQANSQVDSDLQVHVDAKILICVIFLVKHYQYICMTIFSIGQAKFIQVTRSLLIISSSKRKYN